MKKLLFIVLSTLFVVPELFAIQTGASTQGSEFYLSFIRAIHSRAKDMYVIVSADEAGWVKFTDANGVSSSKQFTAGATRIKLASVAKNDSKENNGSAATTVTGDYPNCYTIDAGVVAKQGYVIETFKSDQTTPLKVSLYAGLTNATNTADFANILPIQALGTDYYVISREGSTGNGGSHSEAVVMATEDNTQIEIFPKVIIEKNNVAETQVGKIDITLNRGETYMVRAASTSDDLTGTLIRTKKKCGSECNKIAVFAGTQHSSPGDFEYDQLFPKHLWGTEYLAVPTEDQSIPIVRIVAGESCTEVKINGAYVTTLNQTEFYEYLDNDRTGTYIQTSKPVEVAQFTSKRGASEDNDASMITLAPVQQMLGSVLFSAEDASNKKVTLVAKSTNTSNVTLTQVGGSAMPLAWSAFTVNDDYSYATANVTSGAYKIDASKGGFNAFVYGYSPDKYEYGYSAGSSAIFDELSFELDTLNSSQLNESVCVGDLVPLKANLPGGVTVDNVHWKIWKAKRNPDNTYVYVKDMSGNDSLIADPAGLILDTVCKLADYGIQVQFPDEMKYLTRMVVSKSATTCFSTSMKDSITACYNVTRTYHRQAIDTTVCYGVKVKVPLRSELDGVPEANIRYEWYKIKSDGTVDAGSIVPHDGSTLNEDIVRGTVRQGYVLKTNTVMDPCNVYVDTLYVSVPEDVTTTLTVNGAPSLKICNDGTTTAALAATMTPATSVAGATQTYAWSKGGLTGLTPAAFVPTSSEDITFSARVVDEKGNECSSHQSTVSITAFPQFTASLSATSGDFLSANLLPMSGGNVTFTITTSVPGAFDYVWTPTSENTGVLNETIEGDVSYSAVVWDKEHLCQASTNVIDIILGVVELQTLIDPGKSSAGFAMTTIDANGNAGRPLSDLFSNGYTTYIFDRYGKKICENKNTGWSSEEMAKEDAGVYFYIVEYEKADGSTERMKGSIEIIRNK